MIDYEKLKQACTLAKQYSNQEGLSVRVQFTQSFGHYPGNNFYLYIDDIPHEMGELDDLLQKLQELVQPKPKYEVENSNGCIVEGCEEKHNAKGYCAKHYMRVKNHGDPLIVKSRANIIYDSLEQYFDKNTKKQSNGCLIWIGAVDPKGYGNIRNTRWGKEYKISSAHRLSYYFYKGPIPDDMHILHTCDNPRCVNPDHLFLGTHADNMRDMSKKGRAFQSQGEKGPRAKLTQLQALDIFNNIENKTAYELSKIYGVCVQTIRNIWAGITKYLPEEFYEESTNNLPISTELVEELWHQCRACGHKWRYDGEYGQMILSGCPVTKDRCHILENIPYREIQQAPCLGTLSREEIKEAIDSLHPFIEDLSCEHENDGTIMWNNLDCRLPSYRCKKCNQTYEMTMEQYHSLFECQHESDHFRYMQDKDHDELFYLYQLDLPIPSEAFKKCTKCGEYYK